MKWQMISNSATRQVYQLWNNEKKLLTLEFHPFTNSARIEHAAEKRVFLIRKEGFLRNRTVLRDEYGMRIGQIAHDKSNPVNGTLELGAEKFNYTIGAAPQTELAIFREEAVDPLVTCGLEAETGDTAIQFNPAKATGSTQDVLLMALCWYMFLPVSKEHSLEAAGQL